MLSCRIPSIRDQDSRHFWPTILGARYLAIALMVLTAISGSLAKVAGAEPWIVTSARQVHDMPAEEAAEALPVHLIATVTFYQPGEKNLFVADKSGAVYISVGKPYAFPVHVGDMVEVDGVTQASFRSIVALGARVRVLGPGRQVQAKPVVYRQLISGELDCQRVSIQGTIRAATIESHGSSTVAQMQLLTPGGIVQVYAQRYDQLRLRELIDAEVEVSGVAGADFNDSLQLMRPKLYASGSDDVRLLHEPRVEPFKLPMTAIDRLMESRFVLDQSKRVRVRGAVTAFEPGNSLVIQQGSQNLLAFTRQTDPLPLGSVVDVVGFADDHAYSAVLEHAQFFPLGYRQQITPRPATYAEAMSGHFSDAFVSMRGRVLSELRGEFSDAMVVMVDQHPVNFVMQKKGRASLPYMQPGTLVEVRGICRVTPSAWGQPLLFRLDLRNADDLRVLAYPSWWTAKHLGLAGGGLLGITASILMWVAVLRRRVANQTEQIECSMRVERERSRLLEQINSEMPLDELLQDICATVASLVPGARCSYVLHGEESPCAFAPGQIGDLVPIYEAWLTDAKGRHIGEFRVENNGEKPLSREQKETLATGAGLTNLAVNQRRLYEELNHRSTHDQLTGLPNRRLADTRLEDALTESTRNGTRVGVAYIDVNKFKDVNDKHGHKIGDLYLQQIAGRLGRSVRGSDLLARIGGDEFLLIATTLGSVEDAQAYKERLESCFEHDFSLDGVRVRGAASIGLALYPDHGDSPEALKRYADAAMYEAKQGGRVEKELHPGNRMESFSPAYLEAALKADRFRLYYQPQFSSKGELRGLEALIRLNDPTLGVVLPDRFIHIVERCELVFPIGEWVLRRAVADAARWGLGIQDGARIVVNVSARQVEHPDFAGITARILAEAGVVPERLELEITERCVLSDVCVAIKQLSKLRALGVHVSIDDFGMEHSCLSVLHKLPVDSLKLDRSFVRGMSHETGVAEIVDAVVKLGISLGKRIVAEGIEDQRDIDKLLLLGEMDFQGYLFSKPIPPEMIEAKLEGWRKQYTGKISSSRNWSTPVIPQPVAISVR